MTEKFDDLINDESTPRVAQAGDVVHFIAPGLNIITVSGRLFGARAITPQRGDTLTLTQEIIDAARDRNGGAGWVGLIDDEAAQIQRWGRILVVRGEAPAGMERWVRGDALWEYEREGARRVAMAEADPAERRRKLAAVQDRFGDAPKTSTTVRAMREHPTERAAREQREEYARLSAAGLR